MRRSRSQLRRRRRATRPARLRWVAELIALGEGMEQSHDAGGSWGFFVALLFVVGGSLLIGKVRKGSLGVFTAAGLIAVLAGATTIFGDLIVWGVVAFVYAAAIAFGLYRGRKHTAVEPVSATN